jgi:outer membrane protein OmpA-like peptidoglycan-associated protein
VLSRNLPKALGNQAVSRFLDQGLEVAAPSDPREREAAAGVREDGAPPGQPGEVRLHADANAAAMADALDSRAFTIGHDVFFGSHQFDPSSSSGKDLLAHEQVHAYLHGDASPTTVFRQPLPGSDERQFGNLTLTPDVPPPVVNRSDGATLATIYFGQGNFLIADQRSMQVLERLAEDLRFFVDPVIRVEGFASGEGTEADNLKLSENRRQAVIALLNSQLAQPASVGGTAHGEADPAEPEVGTGTDLDKQRARNRRVEIFVAPRTPIAPAPQPKPIDLRPRFEVRPETDKERLDRILREEPPTLPPKRSLSDAVKEKFEEEVDRLLRKTSLNKEWRDRIRNAVTKAAAAGVEKAIDSAVDASPLGSEERDALKSAIKATLQTPTLPQ